MNRQFPSRLRQGQLLVGLALNSVVVAPSVSGNDADYTYDGIGWLQRAKGKASGRASWLPAQFGCDYDATWNLNKRNNNALPATFNVDNRNQLSTINRSGTLSVTGAVSTTATRVSQNHLAKSAQECGQYD